MTGVCKLVLYQFYLPGGAVDTTAQPPAHVRVLVAVNCSA